MFYLKSIQNVNVHDNTFKSKKKILYDNPNMCENNSMKTFNFRNKNLHHEFDDIIKSSRDLALKKNNQPKRNLTEREQRSPNLET